MNTWNFKTACIKVIIHGFYLDVLTSQRLKPLDFNTETSR